MSRVRIFATITSCSMSRRPESSPPIDELAERVRKLGAKTVHSIGEIAKLQTIKDNDKDYVRPATC